jgi:catechol 2,3-dioxygenase-like lactoylglutathione lyase family enzyme
MQAIHGLRSTAKLQGFPNEVSFKKDASAVASACVPTFKEPKPQELGMNTNSAGSETPTESPKARTVDMRLEIVVIPVSDVDHAKRFYGGLGWRLDADFAAGDDFRVIQFTPPGFGCSIIFGKNVTAATPGSARGLYLIVSDLEAARAELLARNVEVSEGFHGAGNVYAGVDEPYLFGRLRVSGPDPGHRSYRSFASFSDPDGVVTLSNQARERLASRAISSARSGLPPRAYRRRPESSVRLSCCEMTLDVEDPMESG